MIDKVSGVGRDGRYLAKIRKLLNDYQTPDQRVYDRIEYLEALCRKVIRVELEKYAAKRKQNSVKERRSV